MKMLNDLSLIVFLISLIALIYFYVKKQKVKATRLLLAVISSFIVFVITAPDPPEIPLSLEIYHKEMVIYTDNSGQAQISGEVNPDALLTIDGEEITLSNTGYFSHEIQLNDKEEKTVTLSVTLDNQEQLEKITIKGSSNYIAYLQEKLEHERFEKEEAKALATLEVVEAQPNRENYDAAYTLVSSLTRENKGFNERLSEVLTIVEEEELREKEAREAVELATHTPTRANYNEARSLVDNLANEDRKLDEELKVVLSKIEELEQEQQKLQQESQASANQESQRQSQANSSQESGQQSESHDSGEHQYVNANGEGLIKGSSSGIYHIPGSTYYDRTTKPVAWFRTISETEAAGYRAPKR